MTTTQDIVGDDFFSMTLGAGKTEDRIGIAHVPRMVEGTYPITITDQQGRRAWVRLVDGRLVAGGDLPMDEAAEIFLVTMGEMVLRAVNEARNSVLSEESETA
jgi:hypothetical protein